MEFDKDSEQPETNERENSSREAGNAHSKKVPEIGSVGFLIDGIDMRGASVEQIELIAAGQALAELTERLNVRAREEAVLPPPSKVKAITTPDNSVNMEELMLTGDQEALSRVRNDRCYRITADGMIQSVQLQFGDGVKYSGSVTLSPWSMILLFTAKQEALRMGENEISCPHLLLAILRYLPTSAGQLLLGLHLNNVEKPRSLDNLYESGRRVAAQGNYDLIISPVKKDMYLTLEADEALVVATYMAARAGKSLVYSKHILEALLDSKNKTVSSMLSTLAINESEIREALKACPEEDSALTFLPHGVSAFFNTLFRFRIFLGPKNKYRQFSKKQQI